MITYIQNEQWNIKNDKLKQIGVTEDVDQEYRVKGLLLYVKTKEENLKGSEYILIDNNLLVRAINLDQDFIKVESDLLKIYDELSELKTPG